MSDTVSIVDDDAEVRAATASLVRSIGLNARTFGSAEEFLASPGLEETDCLVVDVHMPGMSGLELQGALKPLGRSFPVIVMTGRASEDLRAQAIANGAAAFFEKPFDIEAFLACVEASCSIGP